MGLSFFIQWCVVQCFQSAVTATCTSRVSEERAWKGSGSLSCKESVGMLGATHETLSSWSIPLQPVQLAFWMLEVWCVRHNSSHSFPFWVSWYPWLRPARKFQDSNHDRAALFSFPLFFDIIFLLLECFATNFEVDLIILAFLLWLNGIFLDTNYVIKKVFWEVEVLFKKVSKTYRWENCFQVLHVTPRAPCDVVCG